MTSVASAGSNEIMLGSQAQALRSDSANALTDRGMPGIMLGYARALDVSLADRVDLWATGTFMWGTTDGTMFQTIDTSLSTQQWTVGGRGRYDVLSWLDVTARLDVGATRASVTIVDTDGRSSNDHGWGATVQAAIGAEVWARSARTRRGIGFRLEIGYAATSPISLTPTRSDSDDKTLTLPMQAASFGSLALRGPTIGAVVTTQF
jgi:hypothetical protein